ncbi:MAG TPA: zinc-binding alcohol dehydrogenase family protein [Cellulomonas sp.]
MKAALVTELGRPPRYTEIEPPAPTGPHQVLAELVAAGLHPRVRSQAAGTHYTSTADLPLVPGVDAVVRLPDGTLRYTIQSHATLGTMAEHVLVDLRRSVPLPADADPVQVAAAMNPAMSSWVALRRRAALRPGANVLVLGATGSAGRLAVPVARRLGAGRVTAVGRGAERLTGTGADVTVVLDRDPTTVAADLAVAGRDVDVVLDYLWGEPARQVLIAVVPAREDDSRTLTWVQIGSVAGADCAVPSAALRATRLQLVGSGQGSVPTPEIAAELAELATVVGEPDLAARARTVPLRDVEQAWGATEGLTERVVLVP